MFTASVLINQQLARRQFPDIVQAIAFVQSLTGADLCIARVHSDVMCGAGLCMHLGSGAFVAIARLN